jgi:hypothetical protein
VTHQLAGALDNAASVGIEHGALHPRDVLVSDDEVRVTGLGIARALERIGVPAPVRRPYTAPERSAGPWDRRADVFSLAALAHELLWGRRVTGLGETAAAALTELDGGNLSVLRAVFARGLAEEPNGRFDTALQFAAALDAAFSTMNDGKPSRDLKRRGPVAPIDAPQLPLRDIDVAELPLAEGTLSGPSELGAVESGTDPDGVHDWLTIDMREGEHPIDLHLDVSTDPVSPASNVDLAVAAPPLPVSRQSQELTPTLVPRPGDEASQLPLTPISPPATRESVTATMLPLAFALVVGAAIGFAAGYGVGTVDHSRTADARAVSADTTGASPDAVAAGAAVPTPSDALAAPALETASTAPGAPASSASAPQATPSVIGTAPPEPVADATPPTKAGAAAALSDMQVRSTPSGATVMVDGRDAGRTPLTLRDLTRGVHRLRISRDGFAPEDRRVTVGTSDAARALTVRLTPVKPAPPAPSARQTASLAIESRPAGASVFLDGRLVGKTPLSLPRVMVGDHDVRLEHEGYKRWMSSIRVMAGESNRATASLER